MNISRFALFLTTLAFFLDSPARTEEPGHKEKVRIFKQKTFEISFRPLHSCVDGTLLAQFGPSAPDHKVEYRWIDLHTGKSCGSLGQSSPIERTRRN